jgi:acyl-CoA synthetase (AMP-forming)/AMP-acid ligase II
LARQPCPRAIIKTFHDVYGVEVCHAWGMTEMSPLGTLGSLKPEYADPNTFADGGAGRRFDPSETATCSARTVRASADAEGRLQTET